ncbi:cupin domain-containing protein [Halioxenophilus aromaticivorans]|uniref:Cupin domain-containing protein n=1 Tax=Halioxenophilus aromaticivorans TaxID=1306992 RepID=A0AAV3U9U2_9ALTE
MAQVDNQSPLGDVPLDTFLSQYWQQQPLLIRQAVAPSLLDVDGNDLAALALDSEIESRIITETNGIWSLQHGPFEEAVFSSLPTSHWTLLVQAVDHYLPSANQLLDLFRCLPNWRLDDIMISYAADGGSVGPHYDQYDVFLLQAGGQRHWQIGQHCDASTQLDRSSDLTLVQDFQCTEDYILNPGDMLYLPPGVAHYGIARGDCITYSIGFRSPSISEAFSSFSDYLTDVTGSDNRYRDPGLQSPSGQISAAQLAHFKAWMQAQLADEERLQQWFGQEMTRGKYSHSITQADDLVPLSSLALNDIPATDVIYKALDSRWAYMEACQQESPVTLFAGGLSFKVSATLAVALCSGSQWQASQLTDLCLTDDDRSAVDQFLQEELLHLEQYE